MGVSKAHAGEEEPRERLACVDGNLVDEIAVEEGDLLRAHLPPRYCTVDAADLARNIRYRTVVACNQVQQRIMSICSDYL